MTCFSCGGTGCVVCGFKGNFHEPSRPKPREKPRTPPKKPKTPPKAAKKQRQKPVQPPSSNGGSAPLWGAGILVTLGLLSLSGGDNNTSPSAVSTNSTTRVTESAPASRSTNSRDIQVGEDTYKIVPHGSSIGATQKPSTREANARTTVRDNSDRLSGSFFKASEFDITCGNSDDHCVFYYGKDVPKDIKGIFHVKSTNEVYVMFDRSGSPYQDLGVTIQSIVRPNFTRASSIKFNKVVSAFGTNFREIGEDFEVPLVHFNSYRQLLAYARN